MFARLVTLCRPTMRACADASNCAALAIALALVPTGGVAQDDDEFATFRVTDWNGSIVMKYVRDRSSTGAAADNGFGQVESRASIGANLSTRSFFYHPNFVLLDAAFGTTFQRSRFELDALGAAGQTASNDALYDLSLRATFLRDKPFTGSVFYEHLNPTVSIGPAIVMLQQTTRKGAQAALLAPATSIPLSLEFDRTTASGRGSGRVIDDRTDRGSFTADAPHGTIGSTLLRIDGSRVDSQSGSVDLPIVRTSSDSLSAGLDTRLHFGDDDRHRLSNLITYTTLRYRLGASPPPDRRDLRWHADWRTRHSPAWQTFVFADAARADQGDLHNRIHSLVGGLTWWPAGDWALNAEMRGEEVDNADFSASTRGASASTDYQWALGGGRAQVGYGVRYELRSQRALAPATEVLGERHALPGVTPVVLDRPNVVGGSVRVSNDTRTQVYIEGRDYELSVLGLQTRVQRIVSGDISDAQVVLVDYAFSPGGTFETRQLDQTASVSWSWANRFSIYARWLEVSPTLVSGVPLFGLNPISSRTLGLRAEAPFASFATVGGTLEREDRREAILPYLRTSADLFMQWDDALIGPGSIRLGARRSNIDYDFSTQDVDITGYDVRYRVVTTAGLDLQADWSSERDVGAAVARMRRFESMHARWRYRQLQMTASLTRVREEQGVVSTTRTVGQFLLQRDF